MQDDKKAHQITLQELGIIPKEPKRKEEVRNNMLFLAAVACVATAQTMWKRQTHAQEK